MNINIYGLWDGNQVVMMEHLGQTDADGASNVSHPDAKELPSVAEGIRLRGGEIRFISLAGTPNLAGRPNLRRQNFYGYMIRQIAF